MIDLRQGDCLEVMASMGDGSVDMIATDPPYKVTSRGDAGSSGGMLQKKINKSGMVFKHNSIKISDYSSELFRVLKTSGHCYVMTNNKNLQDMINELTSVGFHFIKCLIWDKGNKIMGQYYMSQFEYILFLRKGKGVKINNCGTSDLIPIPNKKTKGDDGKNIHDTEKPTELMELLIRNSSNEGDIVFDPFVGVGSTGIAAVKNGRKFIGIELDKEYFKIAQERVNEAVQNG